MKRQEALATLGAVCVSGCTSSFVTTESHQAAGEDAWIERETIAEGNGEAWVGEIELEPGEFTAAGWRAWGNAGIVAGVDNVESGQVDIWTFKDGAQDDYRAGDDIVFVTNMSEQGVRDQILLSANVSGKYWIAFDNTPVYGAEPDGTFGGEVAMGAGQL